MPTPISRGRAAMLKAKRRIMLIGWDFDARIRLGARHLANEPETLGDFVLWLVESQPQLEVFVLRWEVGAIRTLFRGTPGVTLLRWMLHKRIFVRLDHATPAGASHHHKIVVIDDCLAFCGGIDMTSNRWDTPEHLDAEPRRISPGGTPYGPWHDATTALEGPVAAALGELARERWRRAGGQPLEPLRVANDCWPPGLPCHFNDVAIAIGRSHPGTAGQQPIREIEATYLDLIAGARRRTSSRTSISPAPHRRGDRAAARRSRRAGDRTDQSAELAWLAGTDRHGYGPRSPLLRAAAARPAWTAPALPSLHARRPGDLCARQDPRGRRAGAAVGSEHEQPLAGRHRM
jgi:hypothetical protein